MTLELTKALLDREFDTLAADTRRDYKRMIELINAMLARFEHMRSLAIEAQELEAKTIAEASKST